MQNIPTNDPKSVPPDRELKNALAFLGHVAGQGGYKLRPTSMHTLNCMQLLDLVKSGDRGPEMAARPDLLPTDSVNAFLFVQAAPVPVVEKAVRRYVREKAVNAAEAWETFIAEAVAPFVASLAPEELEELQSALDTHSEIEAAQVVAKPPKTEGKTERPDPNS